MELLQLQYFLQLANTQHVSRAAEKLHISQPSLSATIKKLENELGAPLFIRKGRNIQISPYGEVFKQHVEQAFLALGNGRQAIEQLKGADDGRLNLGILSPYIWNELFDSFFAAHPEVQISRYSIEDDQFYDSILAGKIDIYLGGVNNNDALSSGRLDHVTLYEDDMVLLVPNSHPFAGRETISLRECANEHFINLDESASLQQFANGMFAKANIKPKVVMVCDYTLRDRMVEENHGVSITTRLSAKKTDAKNVTYITITDPTEKRKLGLVWRRGRTFSPSMQKFCDAAREFYKKI